MSKTFIPETLFDDFGFRMTYAVDKVLFEDKTDHQHMVLFENKFFGKVLMLDGATQVTSRDEYVYHEMMTHVPIFSHGEAKNVLIIGGGDGGIAEEVLKHKSVESVVQVEIDASVVDFSKKYFADMSITIYDDPRFELLIADGIDYVNKTDRRFDVIIVDSTDPQGPGAVLFTREFYAACHRCLTERGVLVTQNGVPFFQADELKQSLTYFNELFADAYCYLGVIPTYIGGFMAMGWASKSKDLRQVSEAVLSEGFAKAGFDTQYYTPQMHKGAFAHPRFIQKIVQSVVG